MSRFCAPLILFCAVNFISPLTARAVSIDWAAIGAPGNSADTTGYGAVGYSYRIDKYEVTNVQYAEFLNAVAKTDTYELYDSRMNFGDNGGITQSGSSGGYSYSIKPGFANLPVVYVTWGDAARFANWLTNSQPIGAQNNLSTEDGSYFLNGATSDAALNAVAREPDAKIVIPNENEWYKAAYYTGAGSSYYQYPTSSNAVPSNSFLDAGNNANFYDNSFTTSSPNLTEVGHFANSESPYGTFDQGGNVREWNEAQVFSGFRGLRGGSWFERSDELLSTHPNSGNPSNGTSLNGFRVASVPEPSSLVLATLGLMGAFLGWRRRKG